MDPIEKRPINCLSWLTLFWNEFKKEINRRQISRNDEYKPYFPYSLPPDKNN